MCRSSCTIAATAERRAQLVRGRAAGLGLSLREVAWRSRLAPATVEALVMATPALSPTRATLVKLARGLDVQAELLIHPDQARCPDADLVGETPPPRQSDATGISRTITVPVLSLSDT